MDPGDKEALRTRCLRAAAERWNWEQESETLLAVYSEILPVPANGAPAAHVAQEPDGSAS